MVDPNRLEQGLARDLDAAAEGVRASAALDGPRRDARKRHRRRVSLTIAVPVVALLFGAGWILAAIADDDPNGVETVDDPPPSPTTSTTVDDEPRVDQLRPTLESMGVDLDEAPPQAITLGSATWCGAEELGQGFDQPGDQTARRCLVEAVDAGAEAVFVRSQPTIEGDPIIQIIRSTVDSTLDVHVDATRDSFGSGGWERLTCRSLDRSATQPLIIAPGDCETDDQTTDFST